MKYMTKTEIKWSVIFTIASLLWVGLEKMMGWYRTKIEDHITLTNLFAIPALAIFILALLDKRRKDYNDHMTWLQGFISGSVITLFIVLLSPLAQIITHKVIAPEYFPNMIDYAVNVKKKDRVTVEAFFNLNSYIIQSLLGSAIIGLITAAVVALFVKKKEPVS